MVKATDIIWADAQWDTRLRNVASTIGMRYRYEEVKNTWLAVAFTTGLCVGLVLGFLLYKPLTLFLGT